MLCQPLWESVGPPKSFICESLQGCSQIFQNEGVARGADQDSKWVAFHRHCTQWRHQKIFCGGASRGQNAILRGQESKNLPKMADFGHFFLLTGGQVGGGRASDWGHLPPMPPPLDAATACTKYHFMPPAPKPPLSPTTPRPSLWLPLCHCLGNYVPELSIYRSVNIMRKCYHLELYHWLRIQ